MQIAVDGPAGVGKSTTAKLLAKSLGITYLDTGAMYRTIAFLADQSGLEMKEDNPEFKKLAENTEIYFSGNKIYANNQEVTQEIREPRVSSIVSVVAANKDVRDILTKQQQLIAEKEDVVMDGRDIGTAVLPNADFKFYLEASPLCRAKRRALEMGINEKDLKKIKEIEENIKLRDFKDMNREINPLSQAEDAVVVQTDNLTVEEVLETMLEKVKNGISGL